MSATSWETLFLIVVSGVPVAWILLHLSHHYCRQLFLVYGFGNRRDERAAILVHSWRVLQWVQRILLLTCYGLVGYSFKVVDTGEASFLVAAAVILAGACPDQWRRSGTISYSYFETLVIIACSTATYLNGVQILPVLGLRDGALVCSIPVIIAIDNALVVRARRTHMPMTFTASIGILSQLLTPYRTLNDRVDHCFEHFHAICNINKVERNLERVGSGVALALYDIIAHMIAGSLIIVMSCTCLKIVAASSLDRELFRHALFIWIAYGSLICTQAAAVGCVYLSYGLRFQRSNPFDKEDAEIFTRWWYGGALAFVGQRAGRWRQQPGTTGFSNLAPLIGNSLPGVGLLASLQPWIDLPLGWAGAAICRLASKFPIRSYVVNSQTRTQVMTGWAIKCFQSPDDIRMIGSILRNFVSLLNCDTECQGVHHPLLKVTEGSVPTTIGRWCTYVLFCAGMRLGFTAPLMDVLIESLRHHNEEEYKIDFIPDGDTTGSYEIFGKKGMLRRVLAYTMFVAGVSASWDVPEDPDEGLTYFTLVQCTLIVVDAHNDFANLPGLVNSLEQDMVLVFGPERAITDDTIATASSFWLTDPSKFDSIKAHSE